MSLHHVDNDNAIRFAVNYRDILRFKFMVKILALFALRCITAMYHCDIYTVESVG